MKPVKVVVVKPVLSVLSVTSENGADFTMWFGPGNHSVGQSAACRRLLLIEGKSVDLNWLDGLVELQRLSGTVAEVDALELICCVKFTEVGS